MLRMNISLHLEGDKVPTALFSYTQCVSVSLVIILCSVASLLSWTFYFFDILFQTAARIGFKFCASVSRVDTYYVY